MSERFLKVQPRTKPYAFARSTVRDLGQGLSNG